MTYKSVPILFLTFNLIVISKGYTDTCPVLSPDQLKQIVMNAAKSKEDNFTQNQFSGVSINGEMYNMRYSETLERVLSSQALANTDNIAVKSAHPYPRVLSFRKSRYKKPLAVHTCKYKVSEIVHAPLNGIPRIQIYKMK